MSPVTEPKPKEVESLPVNATYYCKVSGFAADLAGTVSDGNKLTQCN